MDSNYEYDAFISYAVEDKIPVVNELVDKLTDYGIKVWYASDKFRLGHSVESTIKHGLKRSRHGILILSPHFFKKEWPKKELHALWFKDTDSPNPILTVWHDITEEEVKAYDPHLLDPFFVRSDEGIDEIARKLAAEIKTTREEEKIKIITKKKEKRLELTTKLLYLGVLVVLIGIVGFNYFYKPSPANSIVANAIHQRLMNLNDQIKQKIIEQDRIKKITTEEADQVMLNYNNIDSYYRNGYLFLTTLKEYNYKKYVEPASKLSFTEQPTSHSFGIKNVTINQYKYKNDSSSFNASLGYLNQDSIKYNITSTSHPTKMQYQVIVTYDNHIQYIHIDLLYKDSIKHRQYTIYGTHSTETFQFIKEPSGWQLEKILF